MPYIDAFVIPVPKNKIDAYKKLASKAGKIWMEYGALQYVECVGEDLKIPFGLPFTKLANTKKNETVIFSWIFFKSRKHRDAVNEKVMQDERLAKMCGPENMPFDIQRMSFGGFETLVKY